MGYHMRQDDSQFFISNFNKDKALGAIKALAGQGTQVEGNGRRSFSWVDDFSRAETLGDAMSAWRWGVQVDGDGDVVDIEFSGEKLGDDDVLFRAIAPFVAEDSYIEMVGEDGSRWRWCFEGGKCKDRNAKITWE